MQLDTSKQWVQRMQAYFEQRGRDDWIQAGEEFFAGDGGETSKASAPAAPTEADSQATAELVDYLSDEKADSGGSRGERIQKAVGAESDTEPDSDETEADRPDLTKAFDPEAEPELEF